MTTPAVNPRLAKLPTFRGGLPIPMFVTRDTAGIPDFKVADEQHRVRCATHRVCWLCGQDLGYRIAFLGGPKSAASRYYFDGPMHIECAEDALRLCPFMIGRTDYATSAKKWWKKFTGLIVRDVPTVDPAPPEDMVLYITRDFKPKRVSRQEWLFHAAPATETRTIPRGRKHG